MDSDTVAILALGGSTDAFEQMNVALMAYLSRSAEVLRVTTIEAALTTLTSPSLTSVLVADSAVTGASFKQVTAALVRYAREGGRVIFSSLFGSTIRVPNFKKYFRSEWGLNWEMGEYAREVHSLQETRSERLKGLNSLPPEYSMKAVMLRGYEAGDAVYNVNGRPITTDAAVVFAKSGEGYVGFNGDVNSEAESVLVTLALLNVSQASV